MHGLQARELALCQQIEGFLIICDRFLGREIRVTADDVDRLELIEGVVDFRQNAAQLVLRDGVTGNHVVRPGAGNLIAPQDDQSQRKALGFCHPAHLPSVFKVAVLRLGVDGETVCIQCKRVPEQRAFAAVPLG